MIVLLLLLNPSVVSWALPLNNPSSLERTSLMGDLLSESCGRNYSGLGCMKALAAGLVPAMALQRQLNIWPGLSLLVGGFRPEPISSVRAIDGYLASSFRSFLDSFTLRIRVLDQGVTDGPGRSSRTMVYTGGEEARSRRRRVSNAILLAGLLSAGTILALGMAAISAMAGKALVMSLVSSAVMAMRGSTGNGGGDGVANYPRTTYEIVHTLPHEDLRHRHWSHGGEEYQIVKAH